MDKPNLYVVEGGVGKHLQFTSLIEVQSYNQIFYTQSDFDNTPPKLTYGRVS